ncbi:MAG TPA: hypothetical protein PK255_00240 [Candidatus Pacearchaeota archaeon]|nr:hypothetical protein [Candidatus Pacearchaeota archaeon]HQF82742.1 hypothetical protein [Candidatus Pacearchaeota archaeon]HQI57530.1 hypothetical protein [Candidatus Pacearchaeota archaeon]HQJ57499.1 hypothetical protein [Candidatus Pacearchaeota archaeon]
MRKECALKIIFIISIAGLLFSGYLSYTELIAGYCAVSDSGVGGCTNIAGIPVCVYGFVMYLVIFVISLLGLRSKSKR